MGHLGMRPGRDVGYYFRQAQEQMARIEREAERSGRSVEEIRREHAVGYYLSPAERGAEEPGVWMGKGAAALGLAGQVDPDTMIALYHQGIAPDGRQIGAPQPTYKEREALVDAKVAARVAEEGPYVTADREHEIRESVLASMKAPVPYVDMPFSVAKSHSLTRAGYVVAAHLARQAGDHDMAGQAQARADEIDQVLRETAELVVSEVERTAAYVRRGHVSATTGEYHDAAGVIAAGFLQHTSRDGDPQTHNHIVISTLAQRADGGDDRYTKLLTWALGNHGELPRLAAIAGAYQDARMAELGYAMVKRPDGNGAEIVGVDESTMGTFSSRNERITEGIKPLVDQYTEKYGHAPDRYALRSMKQHVAWATRGGKGDYCPAPEVMYASWEAKARAQEVQQLAQIPAAVEQAAADRSAAGAPFTPADRHRAIQAAIGIVQEKFAAWTPQQLALEVHRQLPVTIPGARADEMPRYIDSLVTEAVDGMVPDAEVVALTPAPELVHVPSATRADGRSVLDSPMPAKYATAEFLAAENCILARAGAQRVVQVSRERARELLADSGLSEGQRRVAEGILSGRRNGTSLIGPAGAGKTHVVGALAKAVPQATGGRVIGITIAENAGRVMSAEGVDVTYNSAVFLGMRPDQLPEQWQHKPVGPGDVLVLDEISTWSTDQLDRVSAIAARSGASWVATGDDQQLASPAAGGMFPELVKKYGTWQLHEVRRFREQWERDASLRLRAGDPDVIREYAARGRVWSGPQDEMHTTAVKHWLADHVAGKDSLLLASSNEEAYELARMAREKMLDLKRVRDVAQYAVLKDGNEATPGDLIRARQNDRDIDAGGQTLANRDTLRIEGRSGDDVVVMRHLGGGEWSQPFTIPGSYLEEHTELAYAGNTWVAEGRTVDTTHGTVSAGQTRAGLYVEATRGRDENHLYVITDPAEGGPDTARPAPETGEPGGQRQAGSAESVLKGVLSNQPENLSAHGAARAERERVASMTHLLGRWGEVTRRASAAAADATLQKLLTPDDYARYLEEPQRESLHRQVRAAEMAGQDGAAILAKAAEGGMSGVNSIAAVLHGRFERAAATESAEVPADWAGRTVCTVRAN